ncbi:hypothetical protein J007_01810 [Cryptococcus neoformans]|nr:hypothetical protein C356_01815 [Cryptococcus neoformans var. grubii c45]OXB38395.1 hypothetical protein J007_01810 [Cryptococcus neoformans var. grubii]OXC62812.1 hypothetical protein C358_01817 [Cryptococcus neoformans var. grubii MW-RSA852]
MKYIYTHIKEFFKISDWSEDIKGPFGLQPPPGDWAEFKRRIAELQQQCPEGEGVKVVFAARHGQAEHNTIKERYQIPDDIVRSCCYLMCKGKWPSAQILHPILDPDLTDLGRSQAAALSYALQREFKRGMPLPNKWYVSPMKRAGETCGIEWGWLFEENKGKGKSQGVPATVIENLREHLHVHECDKRSSLSDLQRDFPSFTYTSETTEEDELWQPGEVRNRETEEELVARCGAGIAQVLDMSKDSIYISITSHSGALRGICKSLGVPSRSLIVGEMNIFVLRVKKIGE